MRTIRYLLALSLVGLAVLYRLPSTAPYTRWKVQSLVRFRGGAPNYYDYISGTGGVDKALQGRLAQLREQFKDDFALQWAIANAEGMGDQARLRERLLQLQRQFPNRPEVYACLLRNEMLRFPIGRVEDVRFAGGSTPVRPANPAAVQRVLEWARRGEQQDPDNAFFLGMQVRALLAQRRDAEAVETLQRAARCARWEDYTGAEAEAAVQLQRLLRNARSGELDLAIATSILFPHLATERSVARILATIAWELEQQGRYRDALKIRMALAGYAQKMTESRGILRRLVGLAVLQIAAAPPRTAQTQSREQSQRRLLAQLERKGFHKEATWLRAELQRGETMRNLIGQAMPVFFDKHIIGSMRQYYTQLLAILAVLGMALQIGSQWLLIGFLRGARVGVSVLIGAMFCLWSASVILFAISNANALMAILIPSIHAAEQLVGHKGSSSLPAPSPDILRWVMPAAVAGVVLLILSSAIVFAVFRYPDSPERALKELHAAVGGMLVILLIGLNLLLLLNWRVDLQLEQFAWGLRHDELGLA
ncbi:MAG: hypothetical protein P3X24_008660, partial [bacterium]|nr:hypothetical protein [bacterium]